MNSRQVVLMLGPARNSRGGMSTVVNSYYDSSLADQYKIIYIATYVDGPKIIKIWQFVKATSLFISYLILGKAKLVHIHCASEASFTRKSILILLAKIFCRKIVIHIHGADFDTFYYDKCNVVKKGYVRKILALSDCIVALSEQWRKSILNIVGEHVHVKVIVNSVLLPAQTQRVSESIHINVLFFGRLGARKGTYDLLKAAESIVKLNKDVRFILCGDGDVDQVKNIVSEKGLTQNFILPGWVLNKEKYFRNADIFVLPSYSEGMPMAVLEAASYGIPIITTPVGGIGEVVIDGVNGFLVQPGDVNALGKRLVELIDDENLRAELGIKALQTIKEKFNIEKVILEVDSLYKELLGK